MTPRSRLDGTARSEGAQNDGRARGERPSKSQRKRDMLALQKLGEALAEVPRDTCERVCLPETLADALGVARRITDHEGRRRQMQYVGRVMRSLDDAEVAALRAALDAIKGASQADSARLHWIERTRERLLAEDDAFTELMRAHPGMDAQYGRTLIRNARREAAQNKPPRYFRELFQWLKEGLVRGAAAARATGAPDAPPPRASTSDTTSGNHDFDRRDHDRF